jgi:hypothetical protein
LPMIRRSVGSPKRAGLIEETSTVEALRGTV